jgi:hypothetical protein
MRLLLIFMFAGTPSAGVIAALTFQRCNLEKILGQPNEGFLRILM